MITLSLLLLLLLLIIALMNTNNDRLVDRASNLILARLVERESEGTKGPFGKGPLYIYIYIYTCMYVCMYVCMYIYIYVCMCVYIYIYIYIAPGRAWIVILKRVETYRIPTFCTVPLPEVPLIPSNRGAFLFSGKLFLQWRRTKLDPHPQRFSEYHFRRICSNHDVRRIFTGVGLG